MSLMHSRLPPTNTLNGLALVRFTGPDAARFLQGQLTQDMGDAGAGKTLLAACNTSQGRVIAVLRLRQTGADVWVLVAADVADPLVAHLKRYVLRAKVQIAVDHGAFIIGRRSGDTGDATTRGASDDATIVFQWAPGREVVVRPSSLGAEVRTVGASRSPTGDADDDGAGIWRSWLAADIADGLPHVTASTSGHFVAQMLNLDVLDAISFNKGCYTGQEIVARTQNLGRIKRRLLRYRVATGEPPAKLASLNHGQTKVGEVLQAAAGAAGTELLAVVSLEARDLVLTLDDGREAEPLALPYAV
jgi:folate-binding protein YgfZ